MDTLTFVAEMTKALAWPTVIGMVALLARKPVGILLEGLRLQKLKGAGWEFEFGRLEAKVQEHVAELPAATPSTPPTSSAVDPDALAAILGVWVELERRVLEASRERFGDKASRSFGGALKQLLQAGAVTAGTVEALQGLQALRNLAVHAPDEEKLASRVPHFITMSKALRFSLEHELKRSAQS